MMQQTQNPFLDNRNTNNGLFITIVLLGLFATGILTYINLYVKKNEDV
jgi:hypothetical protein